MRLVGYLLGNLGFGWRMRWLRILGRIRDLVTLALIMGSVGTAIGYAIARRAATAPDAGE